MPADDSRQELRGAVVRGDTDSLLRILSRKPWPEHALQLIGDGLLTAFGEQAHAAAEAGADCVGALRERDWTGDEELAGALESRLGAAPARPLKPLTIHLEDVAMILEGDPVQGGGRIDRATGEVWPQAVIDYALETGEEDEEDDDPQRWLWVDSEGSRDGYRDMELFIAGLEDPLTADRLRRAIESRGPFRRFKDALSTSPDLVGSWLAFAEDRQRGRARAWLADAGYAAMPRLIGREP